MKKINPPEGKKKDVPVRKPHRAQAPKRVLFYRGMTVCILKEYGFPRNIRVAGKLIPIILHKEAFWRATEPETGTTLTSAAMSPEAAANSARERILVVGVDRFFAAKEAWKKIVLDGLSIAEYARKHESLNGSQIEEYNAWKEEFKTAKPSAEGRPPPRNSKVTPKSPTQKPSRRAG